MALEKIGSAANEPEKDQDESWVGHADLELGKPREDGVDGITATFGQFGPSGAEAGERLNELIALYQDVIKYPGDKEVEAKYMKALAKVLSLVLIGKADISLTVISAGIAALAVLREDGDL